MYMHSFDTHTHTPARTSSTCELPAALIRSAKLFYKPSWAWAWVHPVSITRFPLTRSSPGSGLLRNPFVS